MLSLYLLMSYFKKINDQSCNVNILLKIYRFYFMG
jgi:hypothetical protein